MLTKLENIFFVANIRLNVLVLYPRNISYAPGCSDVKN